MEDVELRTAASLRLGATIADAYRLTRLIGIGGMGAVYEATAMNGSRVAVKMLHRHVSQVPGARDRFHGEALIARRIFHDGVVRIFDDGVSRDGDLYIVMELLEGESIDERMMNAGGVLPMSEVLPIAAAALDAVHAAHETGVIHRDLKPENLFLTTSRTLKVLDFGIAKLTSPDRSVRRTRTGVVMGSPAFMAPEQAKTSLGEVDRRTDVWAMGAVMYTLLSGRPVHAGEDLAEVLASASMRPAQSLARVIQAPLPVVRVVDRALSFDKGERFNDAAEMREAIRLAIVEMREAASGRAVAPPGMAPASSPNVATLVESDVGEEGDPFAELEINDEDRAVLVEHFTLLERALLGAQQYGVRHPETDKRIALAVTYAVEAIQRTGRPLSWNVTPYSFAAGRTALWEPRPPYERVPYQLFADGIRIISLTPGLVAEELEAFLRLITKDRFRDMAPEDDFVTLLWEMDLENVAHQAIDSFGDGDLSRRSRFEEDVQGVQQLGRTQPGLIAQCWTQRASGGDTTGASAQAHDLRVRRLLDGSGGLDAGAVASAEAMLSRAHRASRPPDRALELRDDMVRVLVARLEGDSATVEAKFVRAIGLAWMEARTSGAVEALAWRLRSAIDGMAVARPDLALRTLAALCEDVAQKHPDFAGAVISHEALSHVLAAADANPGPDGVRAVSRVLSGVDGKYVACVLERVLAGRDGPVKDAMFAYLGRPELGNEVRLGEVLAGADEEAGLAILRVLLRMGTPGAKMAVARAMMAPHAVVRVEAIGHVEGASSERLRLELKAMLEVDDASLRMAALQTIEKNAVRVAGPSLVLRIKSPKFDALRVDEKQMALHTLAVLAPRRAEDVCVELLSASGLLPSEAREQTRTVAAELLGRIGTSDESRQALAAAAGSRWRSGEKLREAAKEAHARLSRPPPPPHHASFAPPPQRSHAPPPAQPSYGPPAQPSYGPPAQPSYGPPAQPSYGPPKGKP